MTEKELLTEFYDEVMNAVFNTSSNWMMNAPKKGLEKEWEVAKSKAELLEQMIKRCEE